MATTCAFDESVFVWTEDGYKNADTFSKDQMVGTVVLGKLTLNESEKLFSELYSGNMLKIFNNEEALVTLTSSQRMFWVDEADAIQIGPAMKFYKDFCNTGDKLYLLTTENTKVEITGVKELTVVDRKVWGFRTKPGNLVLKSDGIPLVFSDCG